MKDDSAAPIEYRKKLIGPIATLQDLEYFSNSYQIPMHYSEELPGAFSIVIFQRDEQFVRAMLDNNLAVGILVNYKVLPDDYGDDKIQLVKRMRG